MKICVGSFDHLHMLDQARQLLRREILARYCSTRIRPDKEKIPQHLSRSCYPLHYAFRLYQWYPILRLQNRTYFKLCELFDAWLSWNYDRNAEVLTVLSGVGLNTFRHARKRGLITVVDCGSCHTNFQQRVLSEELAQNGITAPLFPTAYRKRVLKEFQEADYIQVPSRFVKRTFLDEGIPEQKLLMAPYGADIGKFALRTQADLSPKFRVLCASGVNLRKGARILVEAWRKLGWTDAELHWVGKPNPETQRLFTTSIPHLVWHSFMPHEALAKLYQSCDVLVLPSFEEGLAKVLLEGGASGLPPVATPNSGVEDILSDENREGWVIPPNNVTALCDALAEAKNDRQKTFERGQELGRRVRNNFSWERYGDFVFDNYSKILGIA